jgi:hypothetical protein
MLVHCWYPALDDCKLPEQEYIRKVLNRQISDGNNPKGQQRPKFLMIVDFNGLVTDVSRIQLQKAQFNTKVYSRSYHILLLMKKIKRKNKMTIFSYSFMLYTKHSDERH